MTIFLCICSAIILIAAIDKWTFWLKSWTFLCDFEWHIAYPETEDVITTGRCIRCGKKVIRDSNGDWF